MIIELSLAAKSTEVSRSRSMDQRACMRCMSISENVTIMSPALHPSGGKTLHQSLNFTWLLAALPGNRDHQQRQVHLPSMSYPDCCSVAQETSVRILFGPSISKNHSSYSAYNTAAPVKTSSAYPSYSSQRVQSLHHGRTRSLFFTYIHHHVREDITFLHYASLTEEKTSTGAQHADE